VFDDGAERISARLLSAAASLKLRKRSCLLVLKTVLNERCQRELVGRRWRLQREIDMRIDKTRLCTIAVVAMVAGGSLLSIAYPGWNATGE